MLRAAPARREHHGSGDQDHGQGEQPRDRAPAPLTRAPLGLPPGGDVVGDG